MTTKVYLAPPHGVTYALLHWIRVAAAFGLTALASYCGIGNMTQTTDRTIVAGGAELTVPQ